jgi:L,D-peptidoglycan transpeptidase YkuD (ErfK/YbiS/YcfS/YnhG family)
MDKADLFKNGYIARRSGHSKGSAIDLTIIDLTTGSEIDMGSDFDFFGTISHPDTPLITPVQSANRKILRSAMTNAGFKPLSTEWWHFSLEKDPHKDTYFDFPVDDPPELDEKMAVHLDDLSEGADRLIMANAGKQKERATVTAYEKFSDGWTVRFSTPGFFGKNGVTSDKREGDGATPSGVYTFGRAFGGAWDPGSATPYTKVSDLDVWVDDPGSKFYNEWAQNNYPDADWSSAEQLVKFPNAYKYAIAINYNTDPVVPGKGSAIFLHCSSGNPTEGCISVPEPAMVFFLFFIQEGTKIVIIDDTKQ